MDFFDSEIFRLLGIPLLIFVSRVADVSLGTLRIMLVARAYKLFAAMIGFFEVLIWIIAIGQLMDNIDSWITYIAYALGFAVGTYVGIILEQKIAIGTLLIQVITRSKSDTLLGELKKRKYKIAHVTGNGDSGKVDVIYIIVGRKGYQELAELIQIHNPKAFFSIEDINVVQEDLEHMLETKLHHRRVTKKK